MSEALEADLFSLAMSEEAQPLMDAVKKHIKDNVAPITEEFFALDKEKSDRWSWHPRQLELLDGAKGKAKQAGAVELLSARRRYGRGAEQPRLRVHRSGARQVGAGPRKR